MVTGRLSQKPAEDDCDGTVEASVVGNDNGEGVGEDENDDMELDERLVMDEEMDVEGNVDGGDVVRVVIYWILLHMAEANFSFPNWFKCR